jgi:hypothetical protein
MPGAAIARTDLVRNLQQVDADLKRGVRSPEAVSVYGSPSFIGDHVTFEAGLKRYKQPTLGEMQQQCERDKVLLEARAVRWDKIGTCYTLGAMLGGLGTGFGGVLLANFGSAAPLTVAVGIAGAVVGFGAVGWAFWNVSGGNTHWRKIDDVNRFEGVLQKWGSELQSAASQLTVNSPAGPAKVDPAALTASLSTEEKIRLAEQLLQEAKAAQSRPTPTVERDAAAVNINGVRVPVKHGGSA